jgi:hypothetical protein
MKQARNPSNESGAVLFMALIFLVLLTLMALTTFNLSKGTQLIIGNMAARNAAFQVALQASETAISTNRLVHHPDDLFGTGTNAIAVDVNGDARTVISATVDPPKCISIQQVVDNKLDLGNERDLECANSSKNGMFCYDVLFQFATRATDPLTKATSAVVQGASVRSQPASARNICRSASGEPYF